MAEAELQTNIENSEIFKLPSGQEIEKENILSKKKLIGIAFVLILYDLQFNCF